MPSSLTSLLESHSTGVPDYGQIDVQALRAALGKVPDPRARRGVRYPFTDLLLVLVGAVFSGAKTLTMIVEWARHTADSGTLFASGKIPSLATIHRVAARIDAEALDTAVSAWTRTRAQARGARQLIAVDGKEARGAKNGGGTRVFLMAALTTAPAPSSGRNPSERKPNEIPHFGALWTGWVTSTVR